MKKFQFELKGFMPLLMHADDIDGADELHAWRKDPRNKGVSTPGDDRSPPWSWHTYLYRHNGLVVMPSENIMAALRSAGAQLQLKGMKTFKQATQSGMLIGTEACEFRYGGGKELAVSEVNALRDSTWDEQRIFAKDNGFVLDARRAKVGTAKHIRVRPKFDQWTVRGEINILVPELTDDIVSQLFELAGKAGLCDWRPSSPKSPGPYGQFEAVVKKS